MSLEQMVLVGAAAAVALWPGLKGVAESVVAAARGAAGRPAKEGSPSFQLAIENLALVRTRLVKTELLDDASKKAIDALTLALVSGSDK